MNFESFLFQFQFLFDIRCSTIFSDIFKIYQYFKIKTTKLHYKKYSLKSLYPMILRECFTFYTINIKLKIFYFSFVVFNQNLLPQFLHFHVLPLSPMPNIPNRAILVAFLVILIFVRLVDWHIGHLGTLGDCSIF